MSEGVRNISSSILGLQLRSPMSARPHLWQYCQLMLSQLPGIVTAVGCCELSLTR